MNDNPQKIALVTGACGFMGTHMVDYLLSKGYLVRATDLATADRKYLNTSSQVEFIPSDITRKETIDPLLKDVDVVFHLAALFKFGIPWKMLYKVNVTGTKNLCEAVMKFPNIKRVIIWSSGSIYGGLKTEQVVINENARYNSHLGRYERSKALQGKLAMKYYDEKGVPITIIRPAAVYGPRGQYGIAFLIFLMARNLLFVIPGKRWYRGALVHAKDVARAALFLSQKKEALGQVYNVVDDLSAVYDKGELLRYSAKLLGKKMYNISIPIWFIYPLAEVMGLYANITKKGSIITKESLEYMAANYIMDNNKIKNLGFKLLYPDTKVGLRETIEWYKHEKWV